MDNKSENKTALMLSAARLGTKRLGLLPKELRPSDEIEAYKIQETLHGLLTSSGHGSIAGHKIGCTTPIMQRFLHINNPCAGGIFDSTMYTLSASIKFDQLVHPGVECELGVRLKADLPPTGSLHTKESVALAVGSVMAAIEIVDDRWNDYTMVDTPTLIADDFFGAGCVLGKDMADWTNLDLSTVKGSMSINGTEVGHGVGSDIMGHPLEALAWLANLRISLGAKLHAGEFVLLGSLVETKWVKRGDLVQINQPGVGSATVHFT